MEKISRIKYFMFAFLMTFSLISSAEYTVKVFIDGLSVNTTNTPVVEDGDPTEQNGGEAGELTFTVSRTSGYNHNSYILTITSNAYNCFSITQETVLGRFPYEYCNETYPYVENLDLSTTLPGIYTFEVQALDEYGGAAIKSYTFNLEILEIQYDDASDSELSFGYYRKVIEQGGDFSVNINSSTFNCYEINILTDNWGTLESGCPSAGFHYATTVDLSWDFPDFFGNLELEVVGYNIDETTWEIVDRKSYPFNVTVNEVEQIPTISSFNLEFGIPAEYITFTSEFYGDSKSIGNYIIFFAGKTKEYKLDVPSIGYSSGWLNISNYSPSVTEYGFGDPIPTSAGGSHNAIFSVRNGSNIETNNRTLNFGSTAISNLNFNLCNADTTTCYGQSMAIWAGGSGDVASITFSADNTDCMRIQSDDDPEFNIPQTKCYYNGGSDRFAVFYTTYPNHDPIGQTSKVYNYNYRATNEFTGQVINGVFPVTIYYD